ncbi:MAG: MarR family transcriptional regulator [Candidatus Saccharimonadales bacterium]
MEKPAKTHYELLFDFILRVKHEWGYIAEHHDLSLVQLHAIGVLMHGPEPMVKLSNMLSCDASYVTGIVDRLEQQGFVDRHEDPGDRRVKLIALTKKGRALRVKVQQSMNELQESLMACLDENEKAEFNRMLLKINTSTPPKCIQTKNL